MLLMSILRHNCLAKRVSLQNTQIIYMQSTHKKVKKQLARALSAFVTLKKRNIIPFYRKLTAKY